MQRITFSKDHALHIQTKQLEKMERAVAAAHQKLHDGTGLGNDCLGWLTWPEDITSEEIVHINTTAEEIKSHSDILLVIGVGGSYLGARAAIDMLTHTFGALLNKEQRQHPLVLYVGHHLSSTYINDLCDLLVNYDFSINVISKSGTTLEPAIAFRMFEKLLEQKYGTAETKKRIFVTTSKNGGALKKIAESKDYETFYIPENIGGRYSVLTAVGLLPIATSGININDMINGAKQAMNDLNEATLLNNPAYEYAASRQLLYEKGKLIELLISYEPQLYYFSEWWKQLFGESEGKQRTGIFPAAAKFTTDLHSLGQYIQDGRRHLFETVLHIEQVDRSPTIPERTEDIDGLNYLTGETLSLVNEQAFKGALQAHTSGDVPNLIINIPKLNAFFTGYLFYFFQKACAMSGYLQNINPFDQPGVELYKENMLSLLKKQKKQ